MASFPDSLTPLQRDLLASFFRSERGFFLTGGSALAGFHLGHRSSLDLDLFTLDDEAFGRGHGALTGAASAIGASVEILQTTPGFRRYLVRRGEESVLVDLVRERTTQLQEKEEREGIIVDPASEILANKLTTLAGRCEIRDLVDVYFLERSGLSLEDALAAAERKDGGVTPAVLAWVLSQITIGDRAAIPGGVSPAELRQFKETLETKFRRLAYPEGDSAAGD